MELSMEMKNFEKARNMLSGIENGAERAATVSINKTLIKMKLAVKKKVTEEYNIKSGEIEKSLKVRKASFSTLSGTVESKSTRLTLYKFLTGNTGKRLIVKIKKSEGLKPVTGKSNYSGVPFIATMKNGHRGIFQRTSNSSNPIKENYTLGIPQMIGYSSVSEFVIERGREVLDETLEREITRILKGYI